MSLIGATPREKTLRLQSAIKRGAPALIYGRSGRSIPPSLPLYYYNSLESLAVTGRHLIYPSQYRLRYRLQKNA